MAIPKEQQTNFETIITACKRGDLALMECKDKKTGETVDAVCAVNKNPFTGEHTFIPLAFMVREDDVWDRFEPAD